EVTYTLPEYDKFKSRWQLISDCLEGQESVKARTTEYLPMPEIARLHQSMACGDNDVVMAINKRYAQYLQRAVFYNVVQRTHAGMVGQVFAKDPTVELPSLLRPFEQDVDGAEIGRASCRERGEISGGSG